MQQSFLYAQTTKGKRFIDQQHNRDRIIFGAISILAIYMGFQLFHLTFDDLYITYRYAYHFATGQGFVYNIGERFLGTTAPLYGLLIGLMGMIHPSAIPTIAALLAVAALAGGASGLYAYGVVVEQRFAGLIAALLWVLNPITMTVFGSEFFFQTALLTWGFTWYLQGRSKRAAGLLALAVLTRFDSILAVGLIVLYTMVQKRRIPWRELLVGISILAPALLLMAWYYGDPLPGTLEAKLAQRDTGLWQGFFEGVLEHIWTILVGATVRYKLPLLALIPLTMAGVLSALRRG